MGEIAPHNSRRPRAGFTLLELMIVMSLLAIITAMVTPVITMISGSNNAVNAFLAI